MIITWLKIMYYKITKPAVRSRKRADTGADPHAPVHATDSRGLMQTMNMKPGETIRAARVRELYERGIVSVPDGFGDTYRLPQGIVPGSKLADMYLMRRGNARFPGLEKTETLQNDMSVPPYPAHPVAEIIRMSYRPCSVCGDPRHSGNRHHQSPERPADEIEYCGRCQHPWHGGNGAPCGAQVASRMQDGGFHPCPCTGFVTVDDTDEAVDNAWNSFLGLPDEEQP